MAKVYLIGFRGTGNFESPKYRDKPGLIKAGHIGIQLEGDDRIFGFHPTPEAAERAGDEDALVELLLKHVAQPGAVQDDTLIFEGAYQLSQIGERTEVLMLGYELSSEEFQRIRAELLEWYTTQRSYLYNFPRRDGSFADGECNCALFPKILGLQIPSENGSLRIYIEAMIEKSAELWQPKSKS